MRVDIRRRYSMQTMAWLPRLAPNGYRVHLTPWLACLTEWACRQMSGRQSEWSVTPVRRRGNLSKAAYRRRATG